jgi:putative membrane protein
MQPVISSAALAAATAGILIQETGMVFAQASTGTVRDGVYYHGPGMMWGGGSMGGVGMVFGFLFMLLLVVAIVAAVVLVMRSLNIIGPTGSGANANQDRNVALDILKERFAKGEIDAKEFDERRRLLSE